MGARGRVCVGERGGGRALRATSRQAARQPGPAAACTAAAGAGYMRCRAAPDPTLTLSHGALGGVVLKSCKDVEEGGQQGEASAGRGVSPGQALAGGNSRAPPPPPTQHPQRHTVGGRPPVAAVAGGDAVNGLLRGEGQRGLRRGQARINQAARLNHCSRGERPAGACGLVGVCLGGRAGGGVLGWSASG